MDTSSQSKWLEMLRRPIVEKLGSISATVAGAWFCLAFVGMFFINRYPFIQPFVMWTLRLYGGLFVGGMVVGAIGLTVVAPGAYLAKAFIGYFRYSSQPLLEQKLTTVWCVGAGVLFSAVLGSATVLICLGMIAHVKMWFVSLCFTVLLVPWGVIGLIGRRVLRAHSKRRVVETLGSTRT